MIFLCIFRRETLEVDPKSSKCVDFGNIVNDKSGQLPTVPLLGSRPGLPVKERENSADFVDDPDVPPLL